jgi:hypothetical protein
VGGQPPRCPEQDGLRRTPGLVRFGPMGDQRQLAACVLCGGPCESRDHAPSRVFLEPPYPDQLSVVGACLRCNQRASLDEEYVACLIECAAVGSVDADRMRPRIRRKLQEKPWLRDRIRRSHGGAAGFATEQDRVRRVVLKLARGHALYELNEPRWEEPKYVGFSPIHLLNGDLRQALEEAPLSNLWPEAGSRALQRLVVERTGRSTWIEVQAGTYRYMTSVAHGTLVRLVIREYLAAEVAWT